jgi:toxin ParE1/3/4
VNDGTGSWRLAQAAEEDLIDVWLQGARRWDAMQADRYADALEGVFELLAAFPELVRERAELTPPLRVHPHGEHLLFYLARPENEGGGVLIVRVRHHRENWTSDPV